MLAGPRRVGKSVVLAQMAEHLVASGIEPRGVLYLSFDLPLFKLAGLPRLLDLYHQHIHPERRQAFLLLDEVHYAKEWDLEIKGLVDHRPEYRILATGSSSLQSRQGTTESGVGRWTTVHIPTLSFYEFLRIRGQDIDLAARPRPTDLLKMRPSALVSFAAKMRPLMPLFQQYLLVGGFPETAKMPASPSTQRLLREDIVDRVLKRDMTMLYGVRNVADLERLFLYLCYHSGGLFNAADCARELGSSRPSISNFLDLLEQSHLVYRVPLDGLGGKKLLKAFPKVYIVDAALRNAVLLRGEEVLRDPIELSRVIETTILRHLYAFHYSERPRISYWREPRTNREIDVVVRGGAYTIGVEVKYSEDARSAARGGMPAFCESERPSAVYCVTKTDHDFGAMPIEGSSIPAMAIPAHIFAYLLGATDARVG